MKFICSLGLCLLVAMGFSQSVTTKTKNVKTQQTFAKFIGKTPPLRDLVPRAATSAERRKQNKTRRAPRNFVGRGRPFDINPDALPKGIDKTRQTTKRNAGFQVEPIINRQGLTNGTSPHDPSGDIGKNYYIQAINATNFQIFNKDGTNASNPIAANTLWSSLGFSSAGDPIVLYDQEAERWIITEFPSGNQLLFAITETADPFGSWMAYNFSTPSFPDYPKYGVWNNSYYVTTNENGSSSLTSYFINREAMLNGEANVPIQRLELPGFPNGPGFFSPAPVDWSGNNAPATTTQPMVIRMSDDAWGATPQDQVDIFSVNVDWDEPSNTSVTTTSIVTAPFDTDPCSAAGSGFACIPQRGGDGVDGLPFTVMNQVHYYNFGAFESIVMNFVVDATAGDNVAGIRWMEFRKSSTADWSLYQEGTYAPDDGLDRYASASAIDASGNIGLVYAVSSENDYIGLRFTGRKASDPLGEMTVDEYEIVPGTGVNNSSRGRYGDYAQMSVDPVDGKTFWYTGEYATNRGMATRIVAFEIGKDTTNIGPSALLTPQNSASLGGTEPVKIEVTNFGLDTQSIYQLGYVFENGLPVVEPVNAMLLPDSSYEYTFSVPVDMSVIGDYEFKIFTVLAEDDGPFNDTLRFIRTKLPSYDAAITGIGGFAPLNCGDSLTARLVLTNFADKPLTSVTIDVELNNSAYTTINWTGNLTLGESESVDVLLTGIVDGINNVRAFTSLPNGQADEVNANDTDDLDFDVVLDGEAFFLNFTTDNFPQENSWELRDENNQVIASGGPYPGQRETVITEQFCLDPDACYVFTISDSYGDGLSSGGYTISNMNGDILVIGNPSFGYGEVQEFCGNQTCLLGVDIDIASSSTLDSNGAIIITLTNAGSGSFVFSIDGGMTFSSDNTFTGLPPGFYDVVVTNNNGCDYMETVEVKSCALAATATVTNNTNGDNGTIRINVSSGTPNYEYSIDGSFFQVLPIFSNVPPGEYTIYVRDGECTITIRVTVGMSTSTFTEVYGQSITISPNPTTGVFQINLTGLQRSDVFLPIHIYDATGKFVQATMISRYDNSYIGQVSLLTEPNGVYFIRFLDEQVDELVRLVKQ